MLFTNYVRQFISRLEPCNCGAQVAGQTTRPHTKNCQAFTSMEVLWKEWREQEKTGEAHWTWQTEEQTRA